MVPRRPGFLQFSIAPARCYTQRSTLVRAVVVLAVAAVLVTDHYLALYSRSQVTRLHPRRSHLHKRIISATLLAMLPSHRTIVQSYLSGTAMQKSDVLPRHDVYQLAGFQMSDLDKRRLECEDVRIVECESLWSAFPLNLPVLSRPPAISIHKE